MKPRFKELINHNKDNYDQRIPVLTDKIKFKDYATEKGVHTAELLMIAPDKYMKKYNNVSGFLETIETDEKEYGADKGEWWYDYIEPKTFYEEYIPRECEYQFHCHNGKPFWIQIKAPKPRREERLFDIDLNEMFVCIWHKNQYSNRLPLPDNVDELKQAAIRLADNFVYVRVDLFNYNGKIYANELTFAPLAGDGPTEEAGYIRVG